MRYYDVFNGDADGICALHQLRLADPVDSELVTGLKRDIDILRKVPAEDGDVVSVLDISLDRNRPALLALLARGVVVHYFDHHFPGPVPHHPLLNAVIDETGTLCTSALMDRYLRGRYRPWAVVGAFGDNQVDAAHDLASSLGLTAAQVERLRDLGCALNYNAYGETEDDVLVPPREVYLVVRNYADPFEMIAREALVPSLAKLRADDLGSALGIAPVYFAPSADAYVLPDAAWSRRVSGTFANHLALADPSRAHAVLAPRNDGGGYTVSVRSPKGAAVSAVELCHRFAHGGGRRNAAGIDRLDTARLDSFLEQLDRASRPAHA